MSNEIDQEYFSRNFETVTEVSNRLRLTPQYIRQLARAGRVPGALRMGSLWVLPRGCELIRKEVVE